MTWIQVVSLGDVDETTYPNQKPRTFPRIRGETNGRRGQRFKFPGLVGKLVVEKLEKNFSGL